MDTIKFNREEITVVRLSFPWTENKILSKTLTLNDTLIVKYHDLVIDGYNLNFSIAATSKRLKGNFGCQNFSKTTVSSLLAFLDDNYVTPRGKRLIKKTAKSDNSYLKTKVVEESENFFIMETKKVYSKEEYELREVALTKETKFHYGDRWGYKQTKPLRSNYICLNGRRLCSCEESAKNNFKKKLKYILAIFEAVEAEIKK